MYVSQSTILLLFGLLATSLALPIQPRDEASRANQTPAFDSVIKPAKTINNSIMSRDKAAKNANTIDNSIYTRSAVIDN